MAGIKPTAQSEMRKKRDRGEKTNTVDKATGKPLGWDQAIANLNKAANSAKSPVDSRRIRSGVGSDAARTMAAERAAAAKKREAERAEAAGHRGSNFAAIKNYKARLGSITPVGVELETHPFGKQRPKR
jgi:hypothetical protein